MPRFKIVVKDNVIRFFAIKAKAFRAVAFDELKGKNELDGWEELGGRDGLDGQEGKGME